MEEAVKDAILEEATNDLVLRNYLEIAMASIVNHQPIFTPLEEPVLWRKFMSWVREGMNEAQVAAKALDKSSS